MRVIAGEFGGRKLRVPDGIRPTTDRVREALFSALDARGALQGKCVLDLYAGTGALGIEALSRGAASAQFVEANGKVFRVLEENLSTLGLNDRARALRQKAETCLLSQTALTGCSFELVFVDPPYAEHPQRQIFHWLMGSAKLSPFGICVIEAATPGFLQGSEVITEGSLQFVTEKVTAYGDTTLHIVSWSIVEER